MPQKDLLAETLKWCETMKGHSALTIRMTKRSLNFESDNLYSSWQHGMELLAHVWGSEEKHPIEVRRIRRREDVTTCHLLFVTDSEYRRVPEILRNVRGRPVLTVSDRPGFIEAGGMVSFGKRADHLQLIVNPQAARAAELVVSSKLLEVAQVVETYAAAP